MKPVHIVEMGCVTCLGDGVEALWDGVCAGRHGFTNVERFQTKNYVNTIAGCVPCLDSVQYGQRFTKLIDRLLDILTVPSDTILLTATTKDNIELYEQQVRCRDDQIWPNLFVPMPTYVGQRLGLSQAGQNVNAACASAASAILIAGEMVRHDRAEIVLVCSADIVSEFVYSGFSALKVMSPGHPKPFDQSRDGLVIGEGAGFLVLMSEPRMKKEHKTSLGVLAGWGISADARHVTAPAQDGCGLIRTIQGALECGDVDKSQIAGISSHGTGTLHNDAMEIVAYRDIFGTRIPPVNSIKGVIGHTLGACGIFEVMTGLYALRDGILPGTVGLSTPEDDIQAAVSSNAQTLQGDYILTTNSGFGGINTALLLYRNGALTH